jgi:hypothetical protein
VRRNADRLTERALQNQIAAASQGVQRLLSLQYRSLARDPSALPSLRDVELRCFSQNGEDGILLYVFSLVGTTNTVAVEVCAGDGTECNSANLVVNHGWYGVLFDGNKAAIARGRSFYAASRDTWLNPPRLVAAWVTAENVDALIRDAGLAGEIDLLSVDLDGMDYWVWKAIECVQPRVVVVEFNAIWGPERSVSVPYRADFRLDTSRRPYHCGASLAAFVRLGRAKGYRLIGIERHGVNAFFMKARVGEGLFPELTPRQCFEAHPGLRNWHESLLPDSRTRPDWVWVEV